MLSQHEQQIRHQTAGYIFEQLCPRYFCGYDLLSVFMDEFFPRYAKFSDCRICWGVAALTMITMKHELTTRLVQGYADCDSGRGTHAWVEFEYLDRQWVLDAGWYTPFLVPYQYWHDDNHPDVRFTCSHDEFWQYPVSNQFYNKYSAPATSHLFSELIYAYKPAAKQQFGFGEGLDLDLTYCGKQIIPFLYGPDWPISQRIVNQFMAKPNRLRPKQHAIRRAYRYQKIWRAEFDKFIATRQAT